MLLLGSITGLLEGTSPNAANSSPHSQLNILDIDGFDGIIVADQPRWLENILQHE